ncbi:DUF6607 family protein [Methylacidimicrobium tartarophylax]|uniref:Uncharacterized protein n=1 Tax=Methylacidimicrobium tartarophylax TaxID=1041768 RepID=A0A5E6MGE3_9BACT|nr:DUF6607 family protein [Methylacidimicrobium tartarophylax]VVM08181.1 hypothetical protein MAMT_02169 [Methylacidimicrobium tartarophylax]
MTGPLAVLSSLLFLGVLAPGLGAAEPPHPEASSSEKTSLAADREAILAMAGEWRVVYRFEEILSWKPGYLLRPPYKIRGFEAVVLLEDKGGHIALQHLLVGAKGEVTKHWRQDWDYQRSVFWEYAGQGRWRSRDLDPKEVEGSWTQTVWNVDDAPRYAGYGRWRHERGVSEWVSHPLRRPLPRREITRRKDYGLLRSVMHQIVFGDGWILEEENDKVRRGEREESVLAREIGVIAYDKGSGADFPAAGRYLQKTGPFWKVVRSAWNRILEQNREIGYKGKQDAKELAESLFEAAEKFDPAKESEEQAWKEILGLIGEHCFFLPKETSESGR